MPITFNVVEHPATAWTTPSVKSPEDLLKQTSPRDFRHCQRIIQTSFDSNTLQDQHISPSENGFVWSAYHAYSQHHHLTIRPEDVWFAILTQISFYINANAEDLRAFFVDHEGQKELEVVGLGTLESANFGALAKQMANLVSKNVKDPELGSWVMPSFSTTSDTDQVVASVLFMGAMQKYFSYGFTLTCGIPSVTLLGDISDWRDILGRIDKLELLGDEPTQFSKMLRPILKNMVLSFEQPDHPDVIRFWNTIATRNPVGSGTDYITGWITAFCFWDDKGKPKNRRAMNVIDGVSYPRVDIDSVPVGFASVPVKVNDNGKEFSCIMIAGSFGIRGQRLGEHEQVQTSNDGSATSQSVETLESGLLGIQPVSGWLMYENEAEKETKARGEKKMALENELDQINKLPDSDDWEVTRERLYKMMTLESQIEKLEAY
ncbi:hypothetical protein FVEN_g3043 [Fusarium venenatum]|uniref:DUF4419 domain-containing protein n=1 Tax=Fusarium venenatum TaxID=56646 RepID=A0A2L2TQW7_9HYPO|nr:uncharacterized protein FVRRES_06441 [Fusarium venenatum]KAG8359297.1 hypothetical protein FVEN_g3043 [Fusarium venenatum]KAH6993436.1 hypothetical protein EDB82DRAFT_172356 [Fusarium venenatum]CEI62005.1 unnamed protein product [Fusarium venenatum]